MIWHKPVDIAASEGMRKNTLLEALDIRVIEVGNDFLKGDMPVDQRTVQPYGVLHGGASVALAETLGSIAANLVVDSSRFATFGMEINANHLRPATNGRVIGTAKPIHLGKSTHVWSIEIHNQDNKLVCISRITMAIVPKDKAPKV